jgi:hypothetical protein
MVTDIVESPYVTEWVLVRIREMFCGLHGHEHLVQYERGRMFLRCLVCGHESSGWKLDPTGRVVTH